MTSFFLSFHTPDDLARHFIVNFVTWVIVVHESKRAIIYCDRQEAKIIRVTDTYKKHNVH